MGGLRPPVRIASLDEVCNVNEGAELHKRVHHKSLNSGHITLQTITLCVFLP
jgi:hypothetical protein